MIASTSLLARIRSMRAFSTLRILPRMGRMAWVRGSRPPRAEPPAESPSTMNSSHSLGSVDWQSTSLPGKPRAAEQPLAGAGHVTRLAGGDAGRGRGLRLADDVLALGRVALEPVAQAVVEDALHERLGLGVAQLGLGLTLELRLGHLDRDDGGEALADVVAGHAVLALLDQPPGFAPPVDRVGQRRTEALLVGAALVRVDGVGERVDAAGVGRVPLHRDLHAHALVRGVRLDGDHGGVDRRPCRRTGT